jgi:DNA repair exonuclease SbcCD ATPase subunit
MNTKATGNPEALKGHKEASQRQTREDLQLALARLRNGNPKRVKRGTPISAASVAEEASVDRSTLYRYHEPVLTEIRKLNDATPKKQLEAKRGELAGVQAKVREYRGMVEELQAEMNAWARQNYALSHRVHELEDLIRQRDELIGELQVRLKEAGKVTALRPVQPAD